MLNIEIHGQDTARAIQLRSQIGLCMQILGFDAITTICPTITSSCDGKNDPRPFLRILTSEIKNVPVILDGFTGYKIHSDVEVVAGGFFMFFPKDELVSGQWREIFYKKIRRLYSQDPVTKLWNWDE